jgi:AraC-like DNA-binding protein
LAQASTGLALAWASQFLAMVKNADVLIMNSRSFWLKGNRDEYAHFLACTHNANLLDISSTFDFEIKSKEFSSLILRRISISGQCSNSYLLQDAFIGLMISLPGSGFSTRANGHLDLNPCLHHRIHWHIACDEEVYAHHHDSEMICIRIETCRLLRELAFRKIALSTITALDGQVASTGLIQLSEQIEQILEAGRSIADQDERADRLLGRLVDELQLMGSIKATKTSKAASTHVAESLQWLCSQSSVAVINLDQLARAIHVTPRTLQTSFQNQFSMTPMRWHKLWRVSQLHRRLINKQAPHLGVIKIIQASGLGAINTATRAYRQVYGRTPQEELSMRNIGQEKFARSAEPTHESTTTTIDEAIVLLESLRELSNQGVQQESFIHLTVRLACPSLAANQSIAEALL